MATVVATITDVRVESGTTLCDVTYTVDALEKSKTLTVTDGTSLVDLQTQITTDATEWYNNESWRDTLIAAVGSAINVDIT